MLENYFETEKANHNLNLLIKSLFVLFYVKDHIYLKNTEAH